MKVTRKDGPGKNILAELMHQASVQVAQVGFFPSATYPDGTPVAEVAAKQEFGFPEENIPPRPFLRPTIANEREEWRQLAIDGCMMVARGKLSIVEVLEGIGLQAEGDVVKKISSIWTPPLSPYTLYKRAERAGVSVEEVSKKPLVDTGTMLAHVTSAVVEK